MAGRLINLPNILTLSRIAVLPLLAVMIRQGHGITAAVILIIAGITDVVDGWYARKYGMETAFGKLLDPVADKVLVCVAVIFLTARPLNDIGPAQLAPTLGTLILAREFLVTGLRAMAAAEGLVIGAGQTGKLKMFGQFVGLCALMIGHNPWDIPFTTIGVVCLWASVLLSYVSMGQYVRQAYLALRSKLLVG